MKTTLGCTAASLVGNGADAPTAGLFIKRKGFNLSLSGTWVATVHLQRSFDEEVTWLDVDSFTANTQQIGHEPEGAYYRICVKAGNYTSGPVVARLSF